ncbi:hypothetical protein Aph01nite_07050 [Acrocarpospora phusangensis]|uniref:Uncharacterized protein n=1 Tax=Acrocarpospora phusangensis TaxID=1070424 RepID=A0A919Q822_9ACTN|nr:erythromycin esterase family protein [Acrocarpospora phusangensis]GIH22395.1 hypothetical protein Aph01nite_07050 [Acrocarpospora phusangensis]
MPNRLSAPRTRELLRKALLERAIGAVYRPRTERESHYFLARVSEQFDALIHIDETHAIEPLDGETSPARLPRS